MDPYYEQRLRDEVIYLHSLWHQGPLRRSLPYTNLQPCNSTNFKKHFKKTPKSTVKKLGGSFSGKEWPVKPTAADPPLTQSGWPELKLKPNPQQQTPRLPTPEDIEKYNWNQIQQKALKAAKEFFTRNGEDSDEDDDDYVDDMDEDDDDKDEEFEFFLKLINDDEELKGYYVKYCGGGGEFSCLVCGGANEKYRKRFKDCVALIQHSISIAKTKKLRSHRAYGQAVCKVLGWDIDHLPSSIVADYKGNDVNADKDVNRESNLHVDPNGNGHDVSKTVDSESMVCEGSDVNVNKDVNKGANNVGLNKTIDNGESKLQVDSTGNGRNVSETVDDESMVCEDLPFVANVAEENTKKQVLNESDGSAGGAVTNLVRVTLSLSETFHLNSHFYLTFETFFSIVPHICLTIFLRASTIEIFGHIGS